MVVSILYSTSSIVLNRILGYRVLSSVWYVVLNKMFSFPKLDWRLYNKIRI